MASWEKGEGEQRLEDAPVMDEQREQDESSQKDHDFHAEIVSPTLRGPGSCHWYLADGIRVPGPVMRAQWGARKSAKEIERDFPEGAVPQMGRVGCSPEEQACGEG